MNKENPFDSELIKAVLDGEIEKFGDLIERYERLVFSFLLTRLKNLPEVEDISQETFVKAFRHLKSFDCNRKFTAWLLTIARNIMIDHVRKNARTIASTEIVANVVGKECKDSNSNPQEVAIRKESFQWMNSMVNELPEEVREPFLLRVINELSYQEVAEALDLPLQTVKNRIFKARTLLRNKREQHEKMS